MGFPIRHYIIYNLLLLDNIQDHNERRLGLAARTPAVCALAPQRTTLWVYIFYLEALDSKAFSNVSIHLASTRSVTIPHVPLDYGVII